MRKVDVVPYDALWPLLFDIEAGKLQEIFGGRVLEIHHIGSTSVEGMHAKPVIDIMPVVRDIGMIDRLNVSMERIGYEAKREHGIPGRRFFQKGGDDRTHHVHVFEAGSVHIERHLAFRDYLRNHPDEASSYSRLKLGLAARFPAYMDAYIERKNQFVEETERKALAWHRGKSIG
ncbi:GrpB family protein [Lentibacillus sp. CBA3610]|uniref:GrpB family protein n=1 Tax=Lentibacillus sp. CBA3610 TaxID=2518176 RepID=UPI001595C33B|nr:GrpB family protein [Lentibacillus sp. CBA3610]QKY68370.1 GrpB family protein [Lentibacillus sp. CBA3610]